jgi:hypothetical protein
MGTDETTTGTLTDINNMLERQLPKLDGMQAELTLKADRLVQAVEWLLTPKQSAPVRPETR